MSFQGRSESFGEDKLYLTSKSRKNNPNSNILTILQVSRRWISALGGTGGDVLRKLGLRMGIQNLRKTWNLRFGIMFWVLGFCRTSTKSHMKKTSDCLLAIVSNIILNFLPFITFFFLIQCWCLWKLQQKRFKPQSHPFQLKSPLGIPCRFDP